MQELVAIFLDDAELWAVLAALEALADGTNSIPERKLANKVAAKFHNVIYDRESGRYD